LATSLGDRLKEERRKTGLSQEEFARVGGVGRNSQFEYEKGKTPPNTDYLTRLAGSGVDVAYVVTGVRSSDSLAPADLDLLDRISRLTSAHRKAVATVIEGLVADIAHQKLSADD